MASPPSKHRRMPAVEARSKPPKDPGDDPDGGLKNVKEYPPDRYKQVKPAENFARRTLGIEEVDFGKEARIANTVNRALLSLSKRGVPVPHEVRVDPDHEPEAELAVYQPLLGNENAPGRILINPNHECWHRDEAARKLRGQFSTGSRYHAIVHEMGELEYHQEIGAERFDAWTEGYRRDEATFRRTIKGRKDEVAKAVSRYAVVNHLEFVCEVWAAWMLGRNELRKNELVVKIYQALDGPGDVDAD